MKYVILIIACTILLLPTSKPAPGPDPQPPTPITSPDLLDKSTDVYRQLLSEVWSEFSTKRSTFATDEDALKWINERQTATWKAAYPEFVNRAAKAAASPTAAKSFSEDLKNRKLQ